MDVHQVNSRALHDGPDDLIDNPDTINNHDDNDDGDGKNGKTGSDLEKHPTNISSASYQETYPEGGMQAWLVVLGSWFALFSSLGLMNTIAVFQAYVLKNQLSDHSQGTVGWIFSIYTFLAFFCGVYIGPVFDKYGPRWLVISGLIFTIGGLISMSFSKELWQFIISFGLLCGLGTSLLFTPSIAAVGHWFKSRRGLATGVASTAGGTGGIIYPIMQTELLDRVGWGWTVRSLALVSLVCCLGGVLLVRSRLPPAKNATSHPDFRIFRQRPFLLFTVGLFLLEFSLFIPVGYVSTYAMDQGFSDKFAYQLIPIMNAASVIGRALPGYYADFVGPFNVCMGSVVLSVVACFCVWLPSGHTTAGVIMFVILFGFASGTSIAIAPVCVGRLCKTQEYGRYYATCYTIVSLACLIGIPIGGNIIQSNNGDYWGLIVFTGTIFAGSLVFFMWAKASALGWKQWRAAY